MLNRKVVKQKGRIQGIGLFANNLIRKGELVWKMDGSEKRLSFSEWSKLSSEKKKFAYQRGSEYILATTNDDYMNHGCDPTVWWEGDDSLVARRDIQKGEEITYDYSSSDIDERFAPPFKCSCGAKNCRKTVTAMDCLEAKFQQKYKGHLPTWVLEFIHKNRK